MGEAEARRRELERLNAFAQHLLIEGSPGSIVAASVESLVRFFELDAAAFCDAKTGAITRSGPHAGTISAELLHQAIVRSARLTDGATATSFVPLHSGEEVVGSLAVCGAHVPEITLRTIVDRIEARLAKVRVREELRQAEDAHRNQALKTALLDSLAHEIKTPLSVITTAASSLQSKDSDPAIRSELLAVISEEANRLNASINEVLWTARVDASTLRSGKGSQDIRLLVGETLAELKVLLGTRSVQVEISDYVPPADCDIHMIKGVLKELLTNALKYSPSGSPLSISVQQAGDEVVTSVADSGIGVRPEDESRIFEKHYRGTARVPGTGLGLAIAKTIVEAHGGRIGVESRPGGGSVFRFSLPAFHREAA